MNQTGQLRRIYPWLIAAMGLLILVISNGLTATSISAFDRALLDEFGWSRGDLKFRDFVNFACVAAFAPLGGILVDRIGIKPMLIGGCLVLSGAYFAYSRLASVHEMYWIHAGFALALSGIGTMVVIIMISAWFVRHRGLAIGIALVGTSLGGIVLTRTNIELIEAFGWRQAFRYDALLPIVLAVLIVLLVRSAPQDMGASAVGQQAGDEDLRRHGLSFAQAVRTRTFWAIGLSGAATYYSILGLLNHLFLYFTDLGFEARTAGASIQWLLLMAMIAKLVNGAIADVIDRHKVFLACLAVMFVGVVLLASMRHELLWVAVVVIGLGWGGLFTLYNMLAVNNFGLRSLGKINGVISTMESLGGGLGIWLTGVLFDRYGSYQVAFGTIAVLVLFALLVGTQIKSEVDATGRPLRPI
ncbi:MAG: MFS transporter [Steroidobacteraceae bacterium]